MVLIKIGPGMNHRIATAICHENIDCCNSQITKQSSETFLHYFCKQTTQKTHTTGFMCKCFSNPYGGRTESSQQSGKWASLNSGGKERK